VRGQHFINNLETLIMEYFLYKSKQNLIDIGVEASTIEENIAEAQESVKGFGLTYAVLTEEQAHKLIPEGCYCYGSDENGKFHCCPFWDKFVEMPKQSNGFCHYMKQGDFAGLDGGLLWDQIKSCGVKEYQSDYMEL